jgi:hypothetical protein
MKEYDKFVAKMEAANELREKIEAKIREDSRVTYVGVFDTIVRVSTKHHPSYYDPAGNFVSVHKEDRCSEALLNTESPEEYDNLNCEIKEEGKWLYGYIKDLFDVK